MAKNKLGGLRRREPIAKTELENVTALLDKELTKFSKDDLSNRSLADLITGYCVIEGSMIQARYQQCKIMREIRKRFGDDDLAFGQFFKKEGTPTILSEIAPETRTRMLQVADFFDDKNIEGLSWSVAMVLAAPKYTRNGISETVYNEMIGHGNTHSYVKNRLEELYIQKKIANDSAIEGEFQRLDNEKLLNESALINHTQEKIISDEKIERSSSETVSLKPDSIEALEDTIIKLCEPFSILDILSLFRRLIRKFQPKP